MQDAVHLADAFTMRPLMDQATGMEDPINPDRLLRFHGDVENLEMMDVADQLTLQNAQAGGWVALIHGGQVGVLRITEVEEEQEYMAGKLLRVPREEQYGAAARRPWKEDQEEEEVQVSWRDILCLVDLDETGCLSYSSLERLRRLGLEVTGGPQTH